jgi:hypothetical protein
MKNAPGAAQGIFVDRVTDRVRIAFKDSNGVPIVRALLDRESALLVASVIIEQVDALNPVPTEFMGHA